MDCNQIRVRSNGVINEARGIIAAIGNGDSNRARLSVEVIKLHLQAIEAQLDHDVEEG
jgi:DNA-binding GntR family transcriptional regulator